MNCLLTSLLLQFVFFMMPEVSGYPLERIKELFEKKKWYLIGCTQNRPLRVKDEAALGDEVPKLDMQQQEEEQQPKASVDLDKKDDKDDLEDSYGSPGHTVVRTTTAND